MAECTTKDISCRGRIVKSMCLYHYRRARYSKGLYRNFSIAEKEKITTLYNSGLSTTEVSAIIGSSPSGISAYLRTLGITRPRTQKHLLGTKRTKESIEKQRKRMIGKKIPLKTRLNMSRSHRKRLQDYIRKEPQNRLIRKSIEYKLWREAVFSRDDFTCQFCGIRGVVLNADHIKPFAIYPELRFDINNGRTLCVPCHRQTPTYGGNTRVRIGVTI